MSLPTGKNDLSSSSGATPPLPTSSKVLVIDDDPLSLSYYKAAIGRSGLAELTLCSDPRLVSSTIRDKPFDAILLDLIMPHQSGEELLAELRQAIPQTPVIITSGVTDLETALRCIRGGAHDYLVKPIDRERLITTLRRTLEISRLRTDYLRLREAVLNPSEERDPAFSAIITQDPKMLSLFRYIDAIAESPEPVLITGETGTGKDLCAQALHQLSGRSGEFIAVNAAGLDEQLFNDVLFGHRKGSFTGAAGERDGLLMKARDGTIFLDEIGDLPPALQAKLLRVLESGEYYPTGSDEIRVTSARVITATNRTIDQLRQDTRFRQDLFYRLRIHHIHLPPLRERSRDIALLAEFFINEAVQSMKRSGMILSDAGRELLMHYAWPGNIRELKSLIIDTVNHVAGDQIGPEHLQSQLQTGEFGTTAPPPSEPAPAGATAASRLPTIEQATEQLIRDAMTRSNHNQRRAAEILGISQPALSKRLKRLRLRTQQTDDG